VTTFTKIAQVLRECAAELERKPRVVEVVREAKVASAPVVPNKLAALYRERTGVELSPEVAAQLQDHKLAEVVEKLAGSGAPTPMGEAVDRHDGSAPQTKAERAKSAYDRFGNFLTNNGS
jgi:hypothetical protein